MSHNAALIIALVLPALLFVVVRANAAMVFLSACLGAVLVEHVANEANTMMGLFSPKPHPLSQSSLEMILLFVPAIVTTIVTALSVHGKLRVMLNIVPAAGASMLLVLLAVPLLPRGLMFNLESQSAWRVLWNSEALVIGAGAVVSLFFLWSQRRNFRQHDKKKH
ncbi:MAG TPA: hypothetical protein VL737_03435 [Candidatus Pristimantibacillus sp.]|nr:hypothetical protein [Candidatus Pristimantibacillus sp.]